MSRTASSAYGDVPTYKSLGMQRTFSTRSVGTVADRDGLDEDHPAITGIKSMRDKAGQQELEIRQQLKEKEDDMSDAVQRKLERKAIQYHMSCQSTTLIYAVRKCPLTPEQPSKPGRHSCRSLGRR
jgi:hypothetical protein